jgi:hypothetical protein
LVSARNKDQRHSLAFDFFELPPKLPDHLARRFEIRVTRIAVKHQRAGAQCCFKLLAAQGDGLIVIVWAQDIEFDRLAHGLDLKDNRSEDLDFVLIDRERRRIWIQACIGMRGDGTR